MGADVIRLDRAAGGGFGQAGASDPTLRGRQTMAVDLKSDAGRGRCRWRSPSAPTR